MQSLVPGQARRVMRRLDTPTRGCGRARSVLQTTHVGRQAYSKQLTLGAKRSPNNSRWAPSVLQTAHVGRQAYSKQLTLGAKRTPNNSRWAPSVLQTTHVGRQAYSKQLTLGAKRTPNNSRWAPSALQTTHGCGRTGAARTPTALQQHRHVVKKIPTCGAKMPTCSAEDTDMWSKGSLRQSK
jgi:hypothetical protein